ncbi:MAG TPA: hypothetical protein VGM73_00835 [Candidatus Didemnitutus sp.]|jgi:hypothetical protein
MTSSLARIGLLSSLILVQTALADQITYDFDGTITTAGPGVLPPGDTDPFPAISVGGTISGTVTLDYDNVSVPPIGPNQSVAGDGITLAAGGSNFIFTNYSIVVTNGGSDVDLSKYPGYNIEPLVLTPGGWFDIDVAHFQFQDPSGTIQSPGNATGVNNLLLFPDDSFYMAGNFYTNTGSTFSYGFGGTITNLQEVPDGGMSLILFGAALFGLAVFRTAVRGGDHLKQKR